MPPPLETPNSLTLMRWVFLRYQGQRVLLSSVFSPDTDANAETMQTVTLIIISISSQFTHVSRKDTTKYMRAYDTKYCQLLPHFSLH